jgi:hypothetical protein
MHSVRLDLVNAQRTPFPTIGPEPASFRFGRLNVKVGVVSEFDDADERGPSLITSLLRIIGIAMAKPPYLEMGVVVSFSEIFNRPATLEGAREILSQYKREAVLLVLAKLSAALRIWFRPDYQRDNGLAHDVFKNARRAEAHSMAGNPRH